jgi:hypothetical protein
VVIYAAYSTDDGSAAFEQSSTNGRGMSEMGSAGFASEILETFIEKGSSWTQV